MSPGLTRDRAPRPRRCRQSDGTIAASREREAEGDDREADSLTRHPACDSREWPDVVAEFAAEHRRTAALTERLEALITAEDDQHRVTITRAESVLISHVALEQRSQKLHSGMLAASTVERGSAAHDIRAGPAAPNLILFYPSKTTAP